MEVSTLQNTNEVEWYRIRAKNARDIAARAQAKLDQIRGMIPMGQPVLVGHHSESRHRRDLRRINLLQNVVFEKSEEAARLERRASRAEQLHEVKDSIQNLENVRIGDEVLACFTNSFKIYQFYGVVVGQTKNEWKVKASSAIYANDPPGRIFAIPTRVSRKYSKNNRIIQAKSNSPEPTPA